MEKAVPQLRETPKPTRGIMALAKQQKIKPFGIVVGLLAILIILSFFRTGKEKSVTTGSIKAVDTTRTEKSLPDSGGDIVVMPDSVIKTEDSSKEKNNPNHLNLTLQCIKDSSWIMVYGDSSRLWRQVMQKGETKSFEANEHFYVALGRSGAVNLKLNGKDIYPPTMRKGVGRFLVDRQGVRELGYKTWTKMFPNSNSPADSDSSE
jgi:hypothetical protein